ncbi:MAG: hypothetical protein ACPL1Y_03320 [Thermoplasmata archaeon]
MAEQMLKRDARSFSDDDEWEIECRGCRGRLKILPCDVREGFCYDCIDHWRTSSKIFSAKTENRRERTLDDFF